MSRNSGGGKGGGGKGGGGRGDGGGGGKGSGGGKGGGGGGNKDGKGGSKHKPHFVRQIPNFLKQYETLLTTNKKNYMNETVQKEGRSHKSVDDAIADGATVFDESPQIQSEEEDEEDQKSSEAGVHTAEQDVLSVKRTECEEGEEEDVHKEYFKDGKVVFNKVPLAALKRKHKSSSSTDNNDNDDVIHTDAKDNGTGTDGGDTDATESNMKKKKKKQQKKKQLGLLSFDTSDEC